MAAWSEAIHQDIREHVGSAPTEAELRSHYERKGTVAGAALAVLRGRLADMLHDPAKFTADGDGGFDYSSNLRYLRQKVADLEGQVDAEAAPAGAGMVAVSRIVRKGARR